MENSNDYVIIHAFLNSKTNLKIVCKQPEKKDAKNHFNFSTMSKKSTYVAGTGVTLGMIATTSPSKLFKNSSNFFSSLVILIGNRWTRNFMTHFLYKKLVSI